MAVRLTVDYPTAEAFIEAVDLEVSNGGLLVRGAQVPPGETECVIDVRIAGQPVAEVTGQVGAVARNGVAVAFEEVPFELVAHADQLRTQQEEPEHEKKAPPVHRGTAAERIAALTVSQKIQLALSADRESRIALLRDHNKVIHAFVLRNPRIGIDEVLFAAKLNSLAPDALKVISEHPEWGQSMQICTAIVRNPKSPTPVALKLLPRLPSVEIRAIAKGGARDQIVNAARKLLSASG